MSIPPGRWLGPAFKGGGSIHISTKSERVTDKRYISWGVGTKIASATVRLLTTRNSSRNFYEQVAREAATDKYIKEFGPIDWPFASIVIGHHDESITVEIVVMTR